MLQPYNNVITTLEWLSNPPGNRVTQTSILTRLQAEAIEHFAVQYTVLI